MDRIPDSLRLTALGRGAYGVVLLARPRPILGLLGRERPHGGAVVFARVLGVRQLIEAGLLELHGSPTWIATGAGVDAIHALTALTLAARQEDRERRNDLLANALVAAGLALEGLRLARRQR